MPEKKVRIRFSEYRRPACGRVSSFPALILLILVAACRAAETGPAPADRSAEFQETGADLGVISPDPSSEMTAEFTLPPAATARVPDESADTIPAASEPALGSCSDNLIFMGDLTYPDRAPVLAGQALEKQWKVRNGGGCDWGPQYRFRWVGGTEFSARKEYALFPAAAGSEAVISILLTAPLVPGEFISSFRAFSPLGIAFGDTLYIDVVVS
jgi:hypothetical protein